MCQFKAIFIISKHKCHHVGIFKCFQSISLQVCCHKTIEGGNQCILNITLTLIGGGYYVCCTP